MQKRIALILILIFTGGCEELLGPSGGGSVHTPPSAVVRGTTQPFNLVLTAWGSGPAARDRNSDVEIVYWFDTDATPSSAAMIVAEEQTAETEVAYKVALSVPEAEVTQLNYYFRYDEGGRRQTRGSRSSPFSVPVIRGNEDQARESHGLHDAGSADVED